MPPPVVCPTCREELDIPAELRGRAVRCGVCQTTFTPPAVVPRASRVEREADPYRDRLDDRPPRRRRKNSSGNGLLWLLLGGGFLGLCVLCSGCIGFAAILDNPTFQPFESPEGRFTAQFPGPTTTKQEMTDTGLSQTVVECKRDIWPEFYSVKYVDLQQKPEVPGKALQDAADQFIRRVGGTKEESRSDVTQDGLPAVEVHAVHPDGTISVVRFILEGKRLYTVGLTGPGVDPRNNRVEQFFQGFQVKIPPAGNPKK